MNKLARFLNEHRALLMLFTLSAFLSAHAPNFGTLQNLLVILKGACLNAIVATGFTVVLILGQLDLSIGAVVLLSGMLAIGLQPQWGWAGALLAALAAGGAVGFFNGWLVVKARIDSFIVTLGSMTVVTGLTHLYSAGGSKSIDSFHVADWLATPGFAGLPPMVCIAGAIVAGFALMLARTRYGRGFYLVGGNPEAAFLAGLDTGRYVMTGFILCGLTAAAGGALWAASLSAMTSSAALGARTLMTVLAAVIVGGTAMKGGKGSVVRSLFAVLLFNMLFNGIGCYGLGFEVQIFVNGLLLAVVVLYEAYAVHRQNRIKGRRPELMREVEAGTAFAATTSENSQLGDHPMSDKDRFALMCITLTAMTAIAAVAITAIYFRHTATAVQAAPLVPATEAQPDVYSLRGTDKQPYLFPQDSATVSIPERPADPKALPETDKGHWWDIEYSGWKTEKGTMPVSPGNGPRGKKVVLLKAGDHPYWTAYVNGFNTIAQFYGMQVKVLNGNWNMDLQAQQADQTINERPDLIILAPVDATACTPLLRKINLAGIPCITSNTIPCNEAMKYCLAWTGPDDWGQFRMLARTFADTLGKQGGYAIVRHMPGSSPFYSRTFAPITELGEYAPNMKLLAMDTSNLEAEGTMQLVSAWLSKYGTELKGIIISDDGFCLTGALEAVKKAGRMDVVLVAAGNSKTGMDSVKAGEALAVTYQSAEGDGALAVHTAARWFKNEPLAPVLYLPKHIITRADVEQFMPAQW